MVVLDQLELVREPTADKQVIFPVLVVAPDFLSDKALVVLVDGDAAHDTVRLSALSVEVHLALLVEHGLLAIGARLGELIFVHE